MADNSDQPPEYTTITVTKRVKENLDDYRDGRSWSAFLDQLRKEHADPITVNDVVELADRLAEEIDETAMLQADSAKIESNAQAIDANEVARKLAKELDYTQLASQTAEEIEGRSQL